ncbi:hypothetical protein ACE1ET_15930 [Saccharicrinis sp. FJH62]|uniref:glucuronyl esterase domain-containing protein n=1 Tax=Saccharicrinis sp. FJH62 TaxID=3344657 RepID=UPI0035D516DD
MNYTGFILKTFVLMLTVIIPDQGIFAQGRFTMTVSADELLESKEMPDPLTMNDGTKVTTAEQWQIRRQEMIRILEDYEYGHMPPAPGNVKATTISSEYGIPVNKDSTLTANYRKQHLTFGPNAVCGFDVGIFTPADEGPETGYPVFVTLSFNAERSGIYFAGEPLKRGYAVVTIPYNQLGADASSWNETAFFPHYPEYDWRDFSAWAWGISRVVDYLETDPLIDEDKIIISGVSRLGQAVLLAGALDERIAMTAPVAGGMAWRFSGKEMGNGLGQGITEVVDQNTYWFGPNFEKFRNLTTHLPCDQHWLPALTAPRLFILCNAFNDEYGRAYAALQTVQSAQPVYEFLGVKDNLGMHFREGGHGMTMEDWNAILDFADQKLLHKPGNRVFNRIPSAEKLP